MTDPIERGFDPYKVLQVDSEAEPEVVQAAFRRLAQKWHPDLATTAEARAEAASRMVAINRAWSILGNPARRDAYDAERAGGPGAGSGPRPPEPVSRDWTSGRSSSGYTYGPSMRMADGDGAAGPPPGRPSGSVLNFGRYAGWSLGEIARTDLEYIEWLDRMPIGRPYRDEIDGILRRAGRRQSTSADAPERHGLFRRR
jgi:curved DNA-binding protein CbpA